MVELSRKASTGVDVPNEDPEHINHKNPKASISGRDLRASSIGWEVALPIVAGPAIGYFIDRRFDTGVVFTLVLLGLGLFVGVYSLVRFIIYEFSLIQTKETKDKNGNDGHNSKY